MKLLISDCFANFVAFSEYMNFIAFILKRKHIKIVHDENLSNVRFVVKYLKQNINQESILKLFMMIVEN